MRVAIVAAAVLGLAGTAAAATIRVPQDQPTIQAGVNAAATGDTVLVAKGVYTENVVVAVSGITLKGSGVTIDGNLAGTDGPCLTVNNPDLVVTGITFRNGSIQIVGNASGLQALKCTFIEAGSLSIDATSTGLVVDGCKFYGSSGLCVRNVATGTTVNKCLFQHCGNGGVEVTGDGANVTSCTFFSVDDNESIQITGDGAVVTKNKFTLCQSDCIRIAGNVAAAATVAGNKGDRISSRLVNITGPTAAQGAGCTVQKNTASNCTGGIFVLGNTSSILSNKVSNCQGTDAISISGDGFTVTSNTVAGTWNDADGIQADSDTAAGGGTLSGNKVSDAAGFGLNLSTIFNATIASNTVTRCGEDNKGGIFLSGDNNTMEKCSTTDDDHIGIEVDGSGNQFTSCKSTKASTIGILVDAGNSGNTFTDCSATGAGLEGFSNFGTTTNLVRGKYQGGRYDVANDVGGAATFTDPLLAGVKFKTGGAAQQTDF